MMIRSVILAGFVLFASALPARAEFPTNRVYAFMSASPTLNANIKPVPSESGIAVSLPLRPNVEQKAYVYAYNPKDDDAMVTVVLSAGTEAGGEIARTAQPVLVPSKQLVKVALAGRAAPAAAPTAAGKEAPPAGVKIQDRSKLYLRVEEQTDKPGKIEPKDYELFEVLVPRPVSGSNFSFDLTVPREGTLMVKVKFMKQKDTPLFTDKPAKIRLDLRPDLNETIDPESINLGTFEAEVPLDGEATLFAEGIKFLDQKREDAIVSLSLDGFDRALLIRTNFKDSPPAVLSRPFANVRVSSTAQVPGKPVTVTVEADDETNDTILSVDRIGNRSFEMIRNYGKQSRQKAIYVTVGGEGDPITLMPVVKDWSIEFATQNIAGTRYFEVRNGSMIDRQRILIDRTAPANVKLEAIKKDAALTGSEHTLKATGDDDESSIDKVFFYLGDAPAADGKPAPGSKVVPGVKQSDGSWASRDPIRLPENRGEVKIGALFVNGVGLASPAEADVYVREPVAEKAKEEKAKKTTGSIEGFVFQSVRPQPGLPVTLRDATGKEIKKTTTDDSGKFEFKDLMPGEYSVYSVKRADLNSNGTQTLSVEAGDKPAKVEISIKR